MALYEICFAQEGRENFLEKLMLTLRYEASLEVNLVKKGENRISRTNRACAKSLTRGRVLRIRSGKQTSGTNSEMANGEEPGEISLRGGQRPDLLIQNRFCLNLTSNEKS